ncbi:MAG: hypothetical protein R3245_10270, partial [Kiloniellales bacterium]|nr:hypothetical protein [Kiloniellales bacterium]
MLSPSQPVKIILLIIAACAIVIVAAMLVASDGLTLKIIGGAVLGVFLILAIAPDFFLAWENERHVEKYPELLKNEAIGETV